MVPDGNETERTEIVTDEELQQWLAGEVEITVEIEDGTTIQWEVD